MVSLDDAVVARLEKGGKRYEILVDPELVEQFKSDSNSVDLDDSWLPMRFGTMQREGNDQRRKKYSPRLGPRNYPNVSEQPYRRFNSMTTTQRRQMIADKRMENHHGDFENCDRPRSKAPHPVTN